MNQAFSRIWIIVVLIILVAGGFFVWQHFEAQKPVACTQEAKICPDGSAVGRTGPNCEFAVCPTVKTDETADWQTYINAEYGFEFDYPQDWEISSSTWNPKGLLIQLGHPSSGLQFFILNIVIVEDNPKMLSSKQWVVDTLDDARKGYEQQGNEGPYPNILTYNKEYELTLAGLPAYELDGVFAYDQSEEQISLAKGSYIYTFSFPVAEENENLSNPIENNKLVHQILSTFRFLE